MPTLFAAQAVVLVTTAILHAAGLFLFLQWYFWWYDIMLHFLGGLWVALAFQWYAHSRAQTILIVPTLVVVLFVGIGWEVFELAVGAPREDAFMFDASLDILMDVLGGVVGYAGAAYLIAKGTRR